MPRKRRGVPGVPAVDWYEVGAALHRELGDLPPGRVAAVVAERHPAIDAESLYRLGVGYARRSARGLR